MPLYASDFTTVNSDFSGSPCSLSHSVPFNSTDLDKIPIPTAVAAYPFVGTREFGAHDLTACLRYRVEYSRGNSLEVFRNQFPAALPGQTKLCTLESGLCAQVQKVVLLRRPAGIQSMSISVISSHDGIESMDSICHGSAKGPNSV